MKLTYCTLTGVDDKTSLAALARISRAYVQAEWGFLYSPQRQGAPGRYPSLSTIEHAFECLPATVCVALHLCDVAIHNAIERKPVETRLIHRVAERYGRVQFNLDQRSPQIDLDALAELLCHFDSARFITPRRAGKHDLIEAMLERGAPNHAVILDSSDGFARTSANWPATGVYPCGYALNLDPGHLAGEVEEISRNVVHRDSFINIVGVPEKVESRPVWIELGPSLRRCDYDGHDWLSLSRCRACLASVCARPIRAIPEREIAIALVVVLAEAFFDFQCHEFGLAGFYDIDEVVLSRIAERLNTLPNKAFHNKLRRVARTLVRTGALNSRMFGTNKEFFGEPTKQQCYWLPVGKASLIANAPDERGGTTLGSKEGEAAYLIRRAYPDAA